jgi:DNA-directed RNA polymerase subunit RPC12/RpoP
VRASENGYDWVRFTSTNEVRCEECGYSYKWALPVPIDILVAGCEAFARRHGECPEWRQDWRRRLLRVLDERLGQVEAMELAHDWAEGEAARCADCGGLLWIIPDGFGEAYTCPHCDAPRS